MVRYVLCFFLCLTPLAGESPSGETDVHFEQTQSFLLDAFPSKIVNGVNVITGSYNISVTDLELPGTHPVEFVRSYSSKNSHVSMYGKGWISPFEGYLKVKVVEKKLIGHDRKQAEAYLPSGGLMFAGTKNYLRADPAQAKHGMTNFSLGPPSGLTLPWNKRLEFDGKSSYVFGGKAEKYRFSHEKSKKRYLAEKWSVNGLRTKYLYKKNAIWPHRVDFQTKNGKTLRTVQLNDKKFSIENVGDITYKNSYWDGRREKIERYLTQISLPSGIEETYKYNFTYKKGRKLLTKRVFPEGSFEEIDYYRKGINFVRKCSIEVKKKNPVYGRVAEIKAPIGTQGVSWGDVRFSTNIEGGTANDIRDETEPFEEAARLVKAGKS